MILLITAATAAAAFVTTRRLPVEPAALGYLAIAIGGIALAIIDVRVRRLPYTLTGALYAIAAASLAANRLARDQHPPESPPRAVVTAAIVTVAFLILAMIFAGQLGLGDVVLVGLLTGLLAYRNGAAAVLGLSAGLLLQLPAALVAVVRRQRATSFPLGPSLILGWLIAVAVAG